MTEDSHVTRAEFDAMNKQIQDLHRALMEPEPGQSKSLLNRMAEVTISVESGTKTVRMVLVVIALLAALGISLRVGVNLPGVGE